MIEKIKRKSNLLCYNVKSTGERFFDLLKLKYRLDIKHLEISCVNIITQYY